MNHLGEQDASRKRRRSSQRSGAWIGGVFRADKSTIGILTSQEKWDKGKSIVKKWISRAFIGATLNRKDLEKDRGFLVHLSMVYPGLVPYLKGFHLSLESWRPDRNSQGWKLPVNDWLRLKEYLVEKGEIDPQTPLDYSSAPETVILAPRLIDDLRALQTLMSDVTSPLRVVRSKLLKAMAMSFVDASGKGAGASTLGKDNKISILQNIDNVDRKHSSNFKELHNLVDTQEKEYQSGNFHNREVFICTDNSVAERAFYKGNSKSPLLFNLILRLRKLQLKANFKLHVVHVAGSRMIEQGTDGLSRGIICEGLLGSRYNFLAYLPLHKTVISRSPALLTWLQSWSPSHSEVLSPEGWFGKGHDIDGWKKDEANLWKPIISSGCCAWDPAPAVAYKAAEQIRISRHKRQSSTHVFICPRLLTSMWRGQLHKSADLVMEIPVCTSFWNKDKHEPLVLALYFPMFKFQPWFCKGTNLLETFKIKSRLQFLEDRDTVEVFTRLLKRIDSLEKSSAIEIKRLLSFKF